MVYGVGNSKFWKFIKVGDIDVFVKINDSWNMSKLRNILHVLTFGRNHFLIKRAIRIGCNKMHTLNELLNLEKN